MFLTQTHTNPHKHTHKPKDTHIHTQTYTHTHTHKHTHTRTITHTHKHTHTQTHTHTHAVRHCNHISNYNCHMSIWTLRKDQTMQQFALSPSCRQQSRGFTTSRPSPQPALSNSWRVHSKPGCHTAWYYVGLPQALQASTGTAPEFRHKHFLPDPLLFITRQSFQHFRYSDGDNDSIVTPTNKINFNIMRQTVWICSLNVSPCVLHVLPISYVGSRHDSLTVALGLGYKRTWQHISNVCCIVQIN